NSAKGSTAGGSSCGTTDDKSMPLAGLIREMRVMHQEEPRHGDRIGPLDWRKILPFEPAVSSHRLGGGGLEAARVPAAPGFQRNVPALSRHGFVWVARPPEALDLRYEGVKRHRPTPAGSVTLVPAGSPVWARSSGHKDELHIFLQAGLVTRVAAEAFDLDPARVTGPPPAGLGPPPPRAAVGAVGARV